MSRDRPLWLLCAGVAATYPGVSLTWCLTTLLATHPRARDLAATDQVGLTAAAAITAVSLIAVAAGLATLVRGLRDTRGLRNRVNRYRTTTPAWLYTENADLRVSGLTVVDDPGTIAVTVGILRPRVVLSTGLLAALSRAEIRAVLAHERWHQRRGDPLRVLIGRVAAAHLWFVPLAGDLHSSAGREYELTADRSATDTCGRAALASALLRVSGPLASSGAVCRFADAALLDDRVRQLETGRTDRPRWTSLPRSVVSAVSVSGFATTVIVSWGLMVFACPCGT